MEAQREIDLYNACRVLFANNRNRTLTAKMLGLTPAGLRRLLAANLDEYRLFCFLFTPGIRDAFRAIAAEPLFRKQQARKFYTIYHDRIRQFKAGLETTPVGDHYQLYRRIFYGDDTRHRELKLATDQPRHRSLYSLILTLHTVKYSRRKAAKRLALTPYRLGQALLRKPAEALLVLLLLNGLTRARALARRLGLPARGLDAVRRAHAAKIRDYRARLRRPDTDPYEAYQVVFKGHIPGQSGFDLSLLKRMARVYRTRVNTDRGDLPLLFSLPDAFLHPHLLEKVRESSFRFWGEAMRHFLEREKLPFTFAELNRREEEHRRQLLARQVVATLHQDELARAQRSRTEPTAAELAGGAESAPAAPAYHPAGPLYAPGEHIAVRDGTIDEDETHWYLTRIENIPVPTDAEEQALVVAARAGDREAERRLIDANLKLVFALARGLQGRGLELMDLVSEGNLGLLHALQRYHPERKVRFSTYATYWVRKYIHEALGRKLGLSTYQYEQFIRVQHAVRDLAGATGTLPSAAELARRAQLDLEEVERLLPLMMGEVSLDAGSDEGHSPAISEVLVDHGGSTDKLLADAATAATVSDILRRYLTIREELVIRYRMGFGPGFITLPLEEIGKLLGVSRITVQMIEKGAIAKLNDPAIRPLLQELL